MNMQTTQQYLVEGCKWGNEKANLSRNGKGYIKFDWVLWLAASSS